jgi:Leucine-rich repeat (LRR) protein
MKNLYISLLLLLALSVQGVAQVSEQEFQALKAIYNATGGDNWKNRTGWENINTSATKNDVTTAWFGISEIIDGHITSFRPYLNNLAGTLPPQLGDLKWLEVLSFYGNSLTGVLPSEIGNLTSLVELNFDNNKITGPLPQEMTNLSKLKYLYISSNPLNIPFPSTIIEKLFALQILYANKCQFSGVLPDIFDSLTALDYIELSRNQLEGELPPSINRLKKLATLSLSSNQFSGQLPTLDSCSFVYSLSLSSNNFTGSIPVSYGNFTALTNLNLGSNKLSGTIPLGLFTASFQRLYIENNYFTFSGIEPAFNKINALDKKYYYTDNLFPLTQNNISANEGESLTLNATTLSVYPLGGNNNRYKWYKGNTEIYSGNNPSFTVNTLARTDAGNYRFEVTNTVVGNVILKSENITVSVAGSNLPPTNITLSISEVNENFTGVLGILSASDPDAGDTHTFTLATGNGTNDRDNNIFNITGNQLYVNGTIDFEKRTSLNLLITVNDGNGGIYTKDFVLSVKNVNEAPVFDMTSNSVSIDENMANGTTVFDLIATDPEGSNVMFHITTGNDNGAFAIIGSKLVVADNTKLNYDTKKTYTLGVQASDGQLSSNKDLTVGLNKINAQPLVENAVFSIDENSANATVVGTITANDPEGAPLTITITGGNTSSAFAISGKNVTVANAAALDYETNKVFNLAINVSDGISNVPATITINLANKIDETGNDIVAFSVTGMVGNATINTTNRTISAFISKTDITALATTLSVSKGAVANKESGATLNFLTPQTIVVTSETGTTKTWTATVTYAVDVDEVRTKYLRVYPNPAKEFLTITGLLNGEIIQIVDLKGNVLMQHFATSEATKLNIGAMQKGFYILALKNGTTTRSTKLVID